MAKKLVAFFSASGVTKAAADVTGDGWVRVDDAVVILKYYIGME